MILSFFKKQERMKLIAINHRFLYMFGSENEFIMYNGNIDKKV